MGSRKAWTQKPVVREEGMGQMLPRGCEGLSPVHLAQPGSPFERLPVTLAGAAAGDGWGGAGWGGHGRIRWRQGAEGMGCEEGKQGCGDHCF